MREPLRLLQRLAFPSAGKHASRVSRDDALVWLREALDDPDAEFRDGQWEAIEQVAGRRARLFVVQRTGWGKSLVYFLATRLLRDQGAGPTLLISPLLALMRNQVLAADRLGIRAVTLNSSNTDEWRQIGQLLRRDAVDLLLISPEQLASDGFLQGTLLPIAGRVGLFVVDEAHCISDWGHDFRPDYRRITRILQLLPANIPLLATTATANDRVVSDVLSTLGKRVQLVRGPLARTSLRLQTIRLPQPAERLAWLAEQVPRLPGSGIVYTLTIRDAQRVAGWLQSRGIDAQPYWGGQQTEQREDLEERLLDNHVKVVVATTALSMGFDKPDLGFVVHYQRPGSVVHYYQQVGRAGRALDTAYGILLYGREDGEIIEYFMRTVFPPPQHIEWVLRALAGAADGLSVQELQIDVNLGRGQIERVLSNLSVQYPAPVGKQGSRWHRNPVTYVPDPETIRRITYVRRREQARMTAYLQSNQCLMQFLARELDDPDPQPCGRCAVCAGAPLLPETTSVGLVMQAMAFLQTNDQL